MSEAGPSLQSSGDVVFRRFLRARHSLLAPSSISMGTRVLEQVRVLTSWMPPLRSTALDLSPD
eukprot:5034840-Pyramimonas_sp.AAC.1